MARLPQNETSRIGVISDTHGLLRPEAVRALDGVDHILHAGDIGSRDVLDALERIAPVIAVRGNVDRDRWAQYLPKTEAVEIGGATFYILHNQFELDLDPKAAGFAAVITGHSHQPSIETRDGILYLNPGSAGPKRFSLPVTLAKIKVEGKRLTPELVRLESSAASRR